MEIHSQDFIFSPFCAIHWLCQVINDSSFIQCMHASYSGFGTVAIKVW